MAKVYKQIAVEEGTFKNKDTGEVIVATQWSKEGDHPRVTRYPIDGRRYRGIIKNGGAGGTDDLALVYGDWVCEDEKGRLFVKSDEQMKAQFSEVKAKK